MRTIGVITSSRADYGIYRPVLRAIEAEASLNLKLFVTGTHLSPDFGMTVREIERDGFPIAERVEMLTGGDSPAGIAASMGQGATGFARAYEDTPVDLLVALGDRYEMHAAVTAALPFKRPVAHIHGGEVTFGAIDDSLRHGITKMSHLHFATTEDHARRIRQLGEEPWRVHVSGAPSLDNLNGFEALSIEAFEERFGVRLEEGFLLVTFHPVTLEYEHTEVYIESLLEALGGTDRMILLTKANADTYGQRINERLAAFAGSRESTRLVDNLGTEGYFTAMSRAAAVVGNSSSGIIEAASFRTPVVNVGTRQEGRLHPGNVIDTGYTAEEIARGLSRALSPEFRDSIRGLENPYGQGRAAEAIVGILKSVELDERLIHKRFVDWPEPEKRG